MDSISFNNTSAAASAEDVGELYRLLSGRLNRIVRAAVRAPDAVVEDACQFAWGRLVGHRDRVRRDRALAWLVPTAVHEALKLVDRAARETSLEVAIEQGKDVPALRVARSPEKLLEDRERLASLAALPQRQQTALWLYGLGLSYAEIARCQGGTAHAVEHRLSRARKALRKREERGGSARLARAAPTRAARAAAR